MIFKILNYLSLLIKNAILTNYKECFNNSEHGAIIFKKNYTIIKIYFYITFH